MNPEIEALQKQIVLALYDCARQHDGWLRARYRFWTITQMAESECAYEVRGGETIRHGCPHTETYDSLMKLRRAMVKLHENGHAWYTMELRLEPDGSFAFEFDYDHLPAFDIMPDPEDWRDEFTKYPRPELQAHIQDWIDNKYPFEPGKEDVYLEAAHRYERLLLDLQGN